MNLSMKFAIASLVAQDAWKDVESVIAYGELQPTNAKKKSITSLILKITLRSIKIAPAILLLSDFFPGYLVLLYSNKIRDVNCCQPCQHQL